MANRGDDFYRQIGTQIREFYDDGIHETGVVLAQFMDVPLSTAHRWIREARNRGFLGPRPIRCSCRCGLHCPRPEDA